MQNNCYLSFRFLYQITVMITFSEVSKNYTKELFQKQNPALCNLSFQLDEGQTLGLIGANGAGKSTSIRLIMDFIRPSEGTVSLFGRPANDLGKRNNIGYLPETASFPANLSIMDLIRFTGATCAMNVKVCRKRGEMLLKELGLWQARKRRLCTYSKGMQQRANFVLALLNDPELLILDEPMSGLDPLGRGQIITLIQKLKEQGKTILFCSHILEDVDRLADSLLVLDEGQTLFQGFPADFITREGAHSIEEAYLACIKRHRETEYAA